jgi:hypothetical protein
VSETFQSELDQIRTRLAVLRAETVTAIDYFQERQSQIVAVDKLLANHDSQIQDHLLELAAVELQLAEIRSESVEQQPGPPTV